MQTAQHGCQQSRDSGTSGINGNVTSFESAQIVNGSLRRVEFGKNAPGVARQKSPGFRKADAAGTPVDQLSPKMILEMVDLATDGSRSTPLPLGRLTDRTRLNKQNERTKGADLHRCEWDIQECLLA